MLYDLRHVAKLRSIDARVAEQYNPFNPPREAMRAVRTIVNTNQFYVADLHRIMMLLRKRVMYDHEDSTPQLRTATRTWNEGKGNCFEQEGLFLGILEEFYGEIFTVQFFKGYSKSCKTVHEISVHPTINFQGMMGEDMRASTTWNEAWIASKGDPTWTTAERQARREEFISSYLVSSAEMMHVIGNNTRRAISTLEQALDINPNDYTAHCEKGWAYGCAGSIQRARRAFEQSLAMAPHCADVYKEYGDFLNAHAGEQGVHPEECIEQYTRALTRFTYDLQVLLSLEKRFRTLGQRELSHAVRARIAKEYDEEYVLRIAGRVKDAYHLKQRKSIKIKKCKPRESQPQRWITQEPRRRARVG